MAAQGMGVAGQQREASIVRRGWAALHAPEGEGQSGAGQHNDRREEGRCRAMQSRVPGQKTARLRRDARKSLSPGPYRRSTPP